MERLRELSEVELDAVAGGFLNGSFNVGSFNVNGSQDGDRNVNGSFTGNVAGLSGNGNYNGDIIIG
jgi:hypothetical protein